MDAAGSGLLSRAEDAYQRSVRDPCGPSEVPDLIAEARRVGEPEALVVALRAQAWCARHQLAEREAKAYLDEAVRVARRHALPTRLTEVLATRAAVNHELGRIDAAQRDLDTARGIGRSTELDLQQAVLFHNTGRLSQAAELYRQLLSGAAPPDIRVKVGNNLALIESHQGNHASALARLDRLALEAERVGPALVAVVEDSRGWATVQSGRLVEGLRLLDRAAEAHQRAGLSLAEHYLEHSDALVELRLLPEAQSMTLLAYEEFHQHGVWLLAAEAQLRVARLALVSKDPALAATAAASAAALFRRQRRPSWTALARVVDVEARARLGNADFDHTATLCRAARTLERAGMVSWAADAYLAAGRSAARAGRRRAALDSLRRARDLCAGGPALIRLKGHVAAARVAEITDRPREVLAHSRAGLADLARHRAALPSMELQALASGHGLELGRLALASLLPHGSPGEVLQWMERTRAAAFLTAEQPPSQGVDVDLTQLKALHGDLAAARSETGEEPPALLARQKVLEARIRRATWLQETSGHRSHGPVPPAQLRRELGGKTLVEYGTHGDELFAVKLTRHRSVLVPLAPLTAVDTEARKLLFALRRLAQRAGSPAVHAAFHASAQDARSRLRAWLVAPLGLAPDEPVVIVPTAKTWSLPWGALHDGPVSLAPSAASWARTAQRSALLDDRVVLIAGPDLPGAAAEVTPLASLHRGSRVLIPPGSTVDAVVAELTGADLVHLACHGRLRSDNPTFSSFLLSAGELTVHELSQQQTAPRRIVLSACDLGADTSYAGDELVGFVSALFARGTAGLIASCVPVSDAAVIPLMCAVHGRLLRGDTLAEALHAARTAVDQDEPRDWAAAHAFSACGAG